MYFVLFNFPIFPLNRMNDYNDWNEGDVYKIYAFKRNGQPKVFL